MTYVVYFFYVFYLLVLPFDYGISILNFRRRSVFLLFYFFQEKFISRYVSQYIYSVTYEVFSSFNSRLCLVLIKNHQS